MSESSVCVTSPCGTKKWYNSAGQLHREDGPAIEWPSGRVEFLLNDGYRSDGPAIITAFGEQLWMKNGEYHREDGPAVIYPNGSREYWKNHKRIIDPFEIFIIDGSTKDLTVSGICYMLCS